MHFWYQDLVGESNTKFKFTKHFRGSVGKSWDKTWFKYELCIKPSCRLSTKLGTDKTSFIFGLGFFTLYLTIYGLVIPFLPKGRETGFYVFEKCLSWFINADIDGYNKTGYSGNIDFLNILFGETIYFTKSKMETHAPRHFMFRGNKYTMDKIEIKKASWFRSRIPFGLYKKERLTMDLEISKPPMHSGKGTTSYNCDDDGAYGLFSSYDGPKLSHRRSEEIFDHCIKVYCEQASNNIKKYGRVADDRELTPDVIDYKYLGRTGHTDNRDQAGSV